jgi:DNA polymerase-3 subunit epsilon
MLIAFFDFETTGVDPAQDRVTEFGAALYSTGRKRVVMAEQYLVEQETAIPKEASECSKIDKPMCDQFGLVSADALARLQNYFDQAEAVAGTNIFDFDMPLYRNWCIREGEEPIERLIIDAKTDFPETEYKKLQYMCADRGFLNPFPHAALPDAWSSLRIFEGENLEKVLERARSPRVYVKAHVSFDTNSLAKKRKYVWSPAPNKIWYKIMKEVDFQIEGNEAPFDISRLDNEQVSAIIAGSK